MKSITFLMLGVLISMSALSQNNSLVVYSQEGLRFTLILNGVRQNLQPETNVRVSGINSTTAQAKIVIESINAEANQTLYFMDGGEPVSNSEFNYALVKKADKYKLQFKGSSALQQQTASTTSTATVSPSPVTTGTSTGTTTTTTVTASAPVVSTTISAGPVGVSINIDGVNAGTTTTSTTVTSSGSYGSSNTVTESGSPTSSSTTQNNTYVLPGYNGTYGCPVPMSKGDFEDAKRSIEAKSFDDTRVTVAKQIIGSNCLLSAQIKELMLLLNFEANRLDLAKFAWHHNLDKGNYYKLNDAFTFESSIEELNKYTKSH